jgi:hypothetical protein
VHTVVLIQIIELLVRLPKRKGLLSDSAFPLFSQGLLQRVGQFYKLRSKVSPVSIYVIQEPRLFEPVPSAIPAVGHFKWQEHCRH